MECQNKARDSRVRLCESVVFLRWQDECRTNGNFLSQLLYVSLSVDSSLRYQASRLLQIVCSTFSFFATSNLFHFVITAIFPGQPGLAVFIVAQDMPKPKRDGTVSKNRERLVPRTCRWADNLN